MGVINSGGFYYPGIWFSQATPSTTNYFVLEETAGGSIIFNAPTTKSIYFRIANVSKITVSGNDVQFGSGAAGIDYTLSWNGETTDGLLTWMEDEDLFQFNDDIQLLDNEMLKIGTGTAASSDATFVYDGNDLWFDLSRAATISAGFSDFAFKFQDDNAGSEIQFWRKNGVGVGSINSSGLLYMAGLSSVDSTMAATSGVAFQAGIQNDVLNAYTKIDSENGIPPLADCNENNEDGFMIKDHLNDRIYICNHLSGRGWDYISLTD